MNIIAPGNRAEAVEAVRSSKRLRPRGGGTKSALLAAAADTSILDLSGLSGIIEYDPGEYTFTALSGTPVAEVKEALSDNGQYLPFDPPLSEAGSTLGGAVASGLSGPGRYRYGGVRDFLIGASFIDGEGRELRGGGKVVKNAAGFDFPKLLTGSLGELGVLVDLTFKVFPSKEAFATLRVDAGGLAEAVEAVARLNSSVEELFALELEPPGTLLLRLGGIESVLPTRIQRLRALLDLPCALVDDEEDCWRREGEFSWASRDDSFVKIPATLAVIESLDSRLDELGVVRRYGCGGSVAWVCWPAGESFEKLEELLLSAGTTGLILWRSEDSSAGPLLNRKEGPFEGRIRSVLDGPGTFSIHPPRREP